MSKSGPVKDSGFLSHWIIWDWDENRSLAVFICFITIYMYIKACINFRDKRMAYPDLAKLVHMVIILSVSGLSASVVPLYKALSIPYTAG